MGTRQGLWTMGKGEFEQAVQNLEKAIAEQGGDPAAIFRRFLAEEDSAFLRASAAGLIFGESVDAFEKAIRSAGGAPRVVLEGFRTDPEYTETIVNFIVTLAKHNAGPVVPAPAVKALTVSEAKQIMGRNIFDAADWMTYYDVRFTKRQLRLAEKFPWSADFLNGPCPFNPGKLVKDTHFAFLGVTKIKADSLTVKLWMELHPASGQPRFFFVENPWHDGQPYIDGAKEAKLEPRWYLLLKEIVPNSTNSLSEQQIAMLGAGYELPSTIAEVTKDILVDRKTGIRPNRSVYAACRDRTVKTDKVSAGFVSCVGSVVNHGLNVDRWDGNRYNYVGVGASRKF